MKDHKAPVVELKASAVTEQAALEKTQDKSIGVPAARVVTGPADIHKNTIDNFILFLKGEKFNASLEDRSGFQARFMDEIPKILAVKYGIVEDVLDHLVISISENRKLFGQNDALANLYMVEKTKLRPVSEIERYKKFLVFFIMLSDNVQNRQRFIAGYDVRKLCHEFGPEAAANLNNYIHR